eukprot:jgi/Mesvir1/21166/Mv26503-RA.1
MSIFIDDQAEHSSESDDDEQEEQTRSDQDFIDDASVSQGSPPPREQTPPPGTSTIVMQLPTQVLVMQRHLHHSQQGVSTARRLSPPCEALKNTRLSSTRTESLKKTCETCPLHSSRFLLPTLHLQCLQPTLQRKTLQQPLHVARVVVATPTMTMKNQQRRARNSSTVKKQSHPARSLRIMFFCGATSALL